MVWLDYFLLWTCRLLSIWATVGFMLIGFLNKSIPLPKIHYTVFERIADPQVHPYAPIAGFLPPNTL